MFISSACVEVYGTPSCALFRDRVYLFGDEPARDAFLHRPLQVHEPVESILLLSDRPALRTHTRGLKRCELNSPEFLAERTHFRDENNASSICVVHQAAKLPLPTRRALVPSTVVRLASRIDRPHDACLRFRATMKRAHAS